MDRDSNSRLGVETGRGENLDEFRSARLFDISNAPLLISYASTNINLSFQAENQPDPVLSSSLFLFPSLYGGGNKAKFG